MHLGYAHNLPTKPENKMWRNLQGVIRILLLHLSMQLKAC